MATFLVMSQGVWWLGNVFWLRLGNFNFYLALFILNFSIIKEIIIMPAIVRKEFRR